jgi:hypothetical protein
MPLSYTFFLLSFLQFFPKGRGTRRGYKRFKALPTVEKIKKLVMVRLGLSLLIFGVSIFDFGQICVIIIKKLKTQTSLKN